MTAPAGHQPGAPGTAGTPGPSAAPGAAGASAAPRASAAAGDDGELSVLRCTVTVARRGGWSWGPDPRGLVQQVIDTVPEWLADHFAPQLTGDGPDLEITEPVTVTIRPGRTGWGGAFHPEAEVRVGPVHPAQAPAGTPPDAPVPFDEVFAAPAAPWTPPTAAALFGELAERDELEALLALLPTGSLRAYALALLGADDASSAPVAARLLAELVRRARLGAVPGGVLPEALRAGGNDALPALCAAYAESAGRVEAVRLVRALTDEDGPAPTAQAPRGSRARPAPAAGEVRVWSALPFLLAGPLARIGWLDAVGPALAGVELADEAPLFAAALAYKVLGATARGWRREERDSEAAAAFAGLEPPVPEEALTAFARAVRPALPVLDGVLALAVSRGHDPAEPLLLTGTDAGGLLLADAQGGFPLAWADDPAALLPHWRACGRPPVLVCDGPLPPGTLTVLAAADVPFLTALRPLRGDPAVRLPWRTPLWTGAARPRAAPALAAGLPGHTARLAELTAALVAERRAVPLDPGGALERTATLAALLGLSTIAWTLWRDRETPDPLLALHRFADLEATVRFDRDAVRVRVPLGRRHTDLLRGGLLADVPDVPWLGGRPLTFTGG
ncbi:hypothetical protein [Streptomyces sp. enrichment culture]|uniref:hypothetical protein n=1 Tax=Streptomyces sp. enrichment culture TaxID=1795815 RepID=UPI003F5758B4